MDINCFHVDLSLVFFFFNILFWCTVNWMKGLSSKLSRASLLFIRISDFLFLCSPEFLFPAQLSCWSVFVYPSSVGNTAKIRGGLLIFEGWAHSFIPFWIHREVKEVWSLLVPGLNCLYLLLQKSEDRLHHDPRSRAGLPKMLVPWHILDTYLEPQPWPPHLILPGWSWSWLLVLPGRVWKTQTQQLICIQLSTPSLTKGLTLELTSQCD